MKLKGIKELSLLMMLILSSTVFYGQKGLDKNLDSGVVLSLNEAEFFISQSMKADYFEPAYEMMSVKDSLNSLEIANLRNINNHYDSIISLQGSRLNDADSVIVMAATKVKNMSITQMRLESKIKSQRRCLFGTLAIIIIQSVFLSALLY